MKKIRRGVFESNSSSTHSLTIRDNDTRVFADIPKNSKVVLNDSYVQGIEIFDELGKLNFVVTMLASIVDYRNYEDELHIHSFDNMINLNWFRWLAEVVKEESNTDIIYECPKAYNGQPACWIPYYNITWDEYDSIEDIFTDYSPKILEDEDSFKKRVKHIIYNPSVIIENKEIEY